MDDATAKNLTEKLMMSEAQAETTADVVDIDGWAMVELLGKQKIVGYITQVSALGTRFLRVDVPEQKDKTSGLVAGGFTRFFSAAAIYGISPISEQVALAMVMRYDNAPITSWDIQENFVSKQTLDGLTATEKEGEAKDTPW